MRILQFSPVPLTVRSPAGRCNPEMLPTRSASHWRGSRFFPEHCSLRIHNRQLSPVLLIARLPAGLCSPEMFPCRSASQRPGSRFSLKHYSHKMQRGQVSSVCLAAESPAMLCTPEMHLSGSSSNPLAVRFPVAPCHYKSCILRAPSRLQAPRPLLPCQSSSAACPP